MNGLQNQLFKNLLKLIKNIVDTKKIKNRITEMLTMQLNDWVYKKRFLTFVLSLTNQPLPNVGSGGDIHKWIGKIPCPKAGWTPGKYKYMGPYNPLEKQLSYNPETGEVTEWKVKPYNRVDEIAAYHDICYDVGRNKSDCDREMVESLDNIPYGKMLKWGQTARFVINTKEKLGLGLQAKNEKTVLSSDWSQQLADDLHKPITRNFSKGTVMSNGIDEIWAADLVEMQKFSKWNKGIKYLLMVIDVFSKFGWIKPLKDKKTETVS